MKINLNPISIYVYFILSGSSTQVTTRSERTPSNHTLHCTLYSEGDDWRMVAPISYSVQPTLELYSVEL